MTTTKFLPKTTGVAELQLSSWDIDKAIRRAPAPAWLNKHEKLFLYTLNSHDGGERIYPSYATLRRETGIASDQTIKNTIDSLVVKGWLRYAPGDRVSSNEYMITVPAYVQRSVKVSKAGNKYVDFVFTDLPPVGYGGTTAGVEPSETARTRGELEGGTTPGVEASTVGVGLGTTAGVVEVKTLREKESDNSSSLRSELTLVDNLSSQNKDFDLPAIGATLPVLGTENVEEVDRGSSLSGFVCSEEITPCTTVSVEPTQAPGTRPDGTVKYYKSKNSRGYRRAYDTHYDTWNEESLGYWLTERQVEIYKENKWIQEDK